MVLTDHEKQKYLGLIFDCSLSWSHHVVNVMLFIFACLPLPCYRLQIDEDALVILGVVSFVLLCDS